MTALDQRIEHARFSLYMALGLLVPPVGSMYLVCEHRPINGAAALASAAWAAIVAGILVVNALYYTDLLLDRFENTPMCPSVDMIPEKWTVDDIVITPVHEEDDDEE